MNNTHNSRSAPAALLSRRASAALAAAVFLGLPTFSQAICSYGENFDWTDTAAGVSSRTATMPNLDIDRLAASVTVTKTAGGALPAGVIGNDTSTNTAGSNPSFNNPAIKVTASPTYGHGLYMAAANGTGSTEDALTFTFNKSMRNLVMHFAGDDNKIFTLTDAAGNPLEFTVRNADLLDEPPTSGTGANSTFVKQLTANSIALGELGRASIAFNNPVTVVKMTQIYARATINAGANLNTGSTTFSVNFGQFCDQPGVLDYCNNPRFAEWQTSATGATAANVTTATGKIIDETGKVIDVSFNGGHNAAVGRQDITAQAADGAEAGNSMAPNHPIITTLGANDVQSGGTFTQTWTFGETVRNPGLYFRGNAAAAPGTVKFYKADGVTPLPFLIRNPNQPDVNRQVDANTLYAPLGLGSVLQFTESTTAIVAKFSPNNLAATSYSVTSAVFLGCHGTATASGTLIDADTDGDGVSDLTDKCPNTPVGAVVGSDGCPLPTDLSIVKTASVTAITPGVPFDYIITVTNTGAQATNVKASDIVPAGLTINSSVASDSGVVSTNSQTVQALWSIVPAGATRTLTINVTKP